MRWTCIRVYVMESQPYNRSTKWTLVESNPTISAWIKIIRWKGVCAHTIASNFIIASMILVCSFVGDGQHWANRHGNNWIVTCSFTIHLHRTTHTRSVCCTKTEVIKDGRGDVFCRRRNYICDWIQSVTTNLIRSTLGPRLVLWLVLASLESMLESVSTLELVSMSVS